MRGQRTVSMREPARSERAIAAALSSKPVEIEAPLGYGQASRTGAAGRFLVEQNVM